jgi:hypothetical protein
MSEYRPNKEEEEEYEDGVRERMGVWVDWGIVDARCGTVLGRDTR